MYELSILCKASCTDDAPISVTDTVWLGVIAKNLYRQSVAVNNMLNRQVERAVSIQSHRSLNFHSVKNINIE